MVSEKKTKKTAPKKKAVEVANQQSGGWPKMNQGTHLTVKTFEDGRVELQWDDEALLQEVKDAIASVEGNPKKAAPKAKTVEEPKTKRKSKETK